MSACLWSPITRRPKIVSSWTEDDHKKAERYAMAAIGGVGIEGRTINSPLEIAMHYRRETTARERDYVFKTARGQLASIQHEKGQP